MSLNKLLLFFNTIKYLKLRQLIFNFIRRLPEKRNIVEIHNIESHHLKLIAPIVYENKIDNESVCFLNERRSFEYISNWKCLDEPKLWRYNLHYFDFLLDDQASEQVKDELINSWILASRNLKEDAWEPYPISLRLVNWVKYFIVYKNNEVSEDWLSSLYQQAHVLYNSIEYHILANHFFKNGKGLFFAGAYLNCNNSKKWFEKGKEIIYEQAGEQILDDGGHYEKSPMYHSIFVEDFLDIVNLMHSNSLGVSVNDFSFFKDKTIEALNFLDSILMPDGDIPLFNDSAFKIAPHPEIIFNYAYKVLGYKKQFYLEQQLIALKDSGYFIVKDNQSMCIIDCGSVSPDYQPGHTHCDLLSYELFMAGNRVVVDTGLYDYENSEERKYCRSTKAHNTIEIDGNEQSEVWGQFRVARRAEVISSKFFRGGDDEAIFKGSYKPYWSSKSTIVHDREMKCKNNEWVITDEIIGCGEHSIKSYVHLHPKVNCKFEDGSYFLYCDKNKLAKVVFSDNVDVSIENSYYYPEFGKKTQSLMIVLTYIGKLPVKLEYVIQMH
jgi:uncharacterized heparinase superfamily protein